MAQGDNFPSIVFPEIMAPQAYKNNGVIVIWFDETEGGDSSSFTIPEIIISPLAKGNAYDSTLPYTHSSDLKSLEEIFGVYPRGGGFLGNANSVSTNNLFDLFTNNITIAATPGPTVVLGNGAALTDSAVLADGTSEAGSITFTLYNPSNAAVYTDVVTVNGNGTYTTSHGRAVPTVSGTYEWVPPIAATPTTSALAPARAVRTNR